MMHETQLEVPFLANSHPIFELFKFHFMQNPVEYVILYECDVIAIVFRDIIRHHGPLRFG
jgi:hypothetical protein